MKLTKYGWKCCERPEMYIRGGLAYCKRCGTGDGDVLKSQIDKPKLKSVYTQVHPIAWTGGRH